MEFFVRIRWLLAVGLVSLSAPAFGSDFPFGSNDVPSVFRIEKSENANQVHYGLRLDSRCRPIGDEPVVAYWHMLEKGHGVFEPLLRREEKVYGVGRQNVETNGEGSTIELYLRSLEDRPLRIHVRSTDEGCTAFALTDVAGAPARVERIFVKTRLVRIGYVEVSGFRISDGGSVRERFRP